MKLHSLLRLSISLIFNQQLKHKYEENYSVVYFNFYCF